MFRARHNLFLLVIMLIMLALTSCGVMAPDPVPYPDDSNYPTAEIYCNGNIYNGLGVCRVKPGEKANISVQGYYRGTIRVDSRRCELGGSYTYTRNRKLSWELTPEDSCLVDFVVAPKYPRESYYRTGTLKGRLYIKVSDIAVNSHVYKYSADKLIKFEKMQQARKLYIRGCGIKINDSFEQPLNEVSYFISDLNPNRSDCLIEAVAIGKTVTKYSIFLWRYSEDFTPLAIPSIIQTSKKLYITASREVSILSVDKKYRLSNSTKFYTKNPHIIRAITIGGRTALGIWDGEKWQWKN